MADPMSIFCLSAIRFHDEKQMGLPANKLFLAFIHSILLLLVSGLVLWPQVYV